MSGLWRNRKQTPEGKYLVKRRDGSIPEWPYFVLGALDPAAPKALLAYAETAELLGMDKRYIDDIYAMAREWGDIQSRHGIGDPDAAPYREDDPETVAEMRLGRST